MTPDLATLIDKDLRVLEATRSCGNSGWRPWRGQYQRAERLKKAGLLLDAGISVMPPYKLYVLSEAGRARLELTKEGVRS